MQRPKRLISGDVVALANPAGMPPERFRHYLPFMEEYLRDEGFRVKYYLAPDGADSRELAMTFMAAWDDEDVKAVFPICGSDLIYEVIACLQPDALRRPIVFCGSSALSALSLWIAQRTDSVSFFGPHVSFIHARAPQRENEFTIQSFWDMLMWKKGRTKRITGVHERHHFFRVEPEAETALVGNIYEKTALIPDPRRRDISFVSSFSGKITGKIACLTLGALAEMVTRE